MHKTLKTAFAALAMALSCAAQATEYTWTESGWAEWNDPVFWSPNTGYPQAGDTAIFTGTNYVYLCNHATVATLSTSAFPLYLCNDGILSFGALTGSTAGLFSLSGVTLNPTTAMTISNPIAVTTGFDGIVRVPSDGATTLKGKLTGSGYLTVEYADATTGGGLVFDNDTTDYEGIVTVPAGSANTVSGITSSKGACANGKSAWRIFADDTTLPSTSFFRAGSGTTYTFGALDLNFDGTISGRDSGLTFEVGARNEDSSIKGDFGSGSTDRVKWTATSATLSLSATNLATLEVAGGTVALASGVVPNAIQLTGGYLKAADSATLASALTKVSDSTYLGFDLDADLTLDKADIPSGVTTIGKKGTGTLTLTGTFTDGTLALVIDGGDVKIPKDSVLASVKFAADDATCRLYITGVGEDPALDTTILTINAIASGSVTPTRDNFEFTDNASNPKCAYLDGTAVKIGNRIFPYVWAGTTDNLWTNETNWTYNEEPATRAPTQADDAVTFNTAATVTIPSDLTVSCGTITMNANAEVSGGTLIPGAIKGAGVFTMAGLEINATDINLTISSGLCIKTNTENTIRYTGNHVAVSGPLSGEGTLTTKSPSASDTGGLVLSGDNSNFAGTYVSTQVKYDTTTFSRAESWSGKAFWKINESYGGSGVNNTTLVGGSWEMAIGAFNGNLTVPWSYGPTIEIGAREDVDSVMNFTSRNASGPATAIRKVGSGLVTIKYWTKFDGDYGQLYSLDLMGGTLELNAARLLPSQYITFGGEGAVLKLDQAMDPSALFKDSVSAIAIDDNGVDNTFNSVITEDNCVGFTKKGAGTLTFAVAPEYVGVTTVEEGTLVFPKGATVSSVKMLAGAYLAVAADSYAIGDELLTVGSVDTTEGVALTSANLKLMGASAVLMGDPVKQADGSYKIVVVADTKKYMWSGAAGDGLWETPGNWTKAGAIPDNAPTLGTDEVAFLQDAVVTMPSTLTTYTEENLTLEAAVTFSYSSLTFSTQTIDQDVAFQATTYTLSDSATLSGEATITFKGGQLSYGSTSNNGAINVAGLVIDNATLYNGNKKYFNISSAIEFAGECQLTANGSGRLCLTGDVSGEGDIVASANKGTLVLEGSWSSFSGSLVYTVSTTDAGGYLANNGTNFMNTACSFYATGTVPYYSGTKSGSLEKWLFRCHDKTILFGSLKAKIPYNNYMTTGGDYKNNLLKVGYLDEDSWVAGSYGEVASKSLHSIEWVAPTAELKYSTTNTYAVVVSGGGVVNFATPEGEASTGGIPANGISFTGAGGYVVCESNTFAAVTNAIKNSTAPIGFTVAAGETFELDPAMLDASNTLKVFQKAGEGTLSVAENTLFTNLTDRLKRTITITDLPAGKRVAFETVDGCEKAVVAEGYTDLEFDIGSGVTSNHVGTISGASNLVKKGDGTLVLIGNNAFEGAVQVDAGTLKLGDYSDLSGVLYDFDASQSDKLEYGTDGIIKMYDSVSGNEYFETITNTVTGAGNKYTYRGHCAMPTNDAAIFGGKTVIASDMFRMASSWKTLNSSTTRSFILLGQYLQNPLHNYLISDWDDTYYGLRYRIECADGKAVRWYSNGTKVYTGYRVNGVENGSLGYPDPFIFSTTNNMMRSDKTNRKQCLGGAYGFAFAEYLVYDRKLSVEELEVAECTLKAKWGLADYTPIPTTADITVASGATLNLGAQMPTVASVTIASGATVAMDTIPESGYLITTTVGHAADLTGVTFLVGGVDMTSQLVVTQTAEGLRVARPMAEYDVAEGDTEVVVGAFTPYLASLTKTGDGTLTLVGDNTFEGAVNVDAGTLKIDAPYQHIGTQLARFDTTYADTIAYTDGTFSAISDLIHGTVSLKSSGNVIPEVGAYAGVLGGKTVLHSTYLKLLMSSQVAAHKTTFMVAKLTLGSGNNVITDNQNEKFGVIRRNSLNYYQWRAYLNSKDTYSPNDVYVNGVNPAHAASGEEFVMCVDTNAWKRYPNGAGMYHFGSGYEGYMGEVILYQEDLDATQRGVMEDYLMTKWSVGTASYNPIPVGADIAVATGATLDLGEFQPTVTSLSLESGSTIAVDSVPSDKVLLTANEITLGENITVKIGGETKSTYRLRVHDNGDGTYSLRLMPPGLRIIFH